MERPATGIRRQRAKTARTITNRNFSDRVIERCSGVGVRRTLDGASERLSRGSGVSAPDPLKAFIWRLPASRPGLDEALYTVRAAMQIGAASKSARKQQDLFVSN